MRNVLKMSAITLASVLAFGSAQASETASGRVDISVSGFEQTGGKLMVALFSNPQSYQSSKALRGVALDVNSKSVSLSMDDLPVGEYAIKLFYDVNSNGALDTNLFGIPKEPFGFSNNAPANFGPAKWQAAKFQITDQASHQNIDLVQMAR